MQVVVFGGHGLLGHSLVSLLLGHDHEVASPARQDIDCRDARAVHAFLEPLHPDAVIVAAGKVGGLMANMRHGAEYLYDNALINLVVLKVCEQLGIPRAIVFGSSCMYPRDMDDPIREADLLSGPLEPTSEPYALAKIIAVRYANLLYQQGRCRAIACILTNLYGDHDRFDAQEGHLIASLIVRMHEAQGRGDRAIALWGDGTPRRDFLHASDAARACLTILEAADIPDTLNVGSGTDVAVHEIAQKVAKTVGFQGDLVFTGEVSNGVARKLLAIDRIAALGWRPLLSLDEGLRSAYDGYLAQRRQNARAMRG